MVAQQGQTQYEAFPHATAGTAPGGTYPWCAFGAPPHPHGHAWQSRGHGLGHHRGSVRPPRGMVGQGPWGRSLPQPAPSSPPIARGSPLTPWLAMPLQVLCRSQSVINCQKQTLVGSAAWGCSAPRAREARCCSFPPPSPGPHVCRRVRDAHGANTSGRTGRGNRRNVLLLEPK